MILKKGLWIFLFDHHTNAFKLAKVNKQNKDESTRLDFADGTSETLNLDQRRWIPAEGIRVKKANSNETGRIHSVRASVVKIKPDAGGRIVEWNLKKKKRDWTIHEDEVSNRVGF